MPWIVPFIPMIVSTVVSAGSSAVTASQQEKRAHHEAKKQRQAWAEMSKPDPAALEAAATQNRGQLAQGRLGSYQNLASNLAARGFGSGSGLAAGESQNIERGYLQGLGQQATELTKFGLTSQFAPPAGAFGATGTTSAGGAAATSLAGSMNQALGWSMMKNLYGSQTPQASTGPTQFQYNRNITPLANQNYYNLNQPAGQNYYDYNTMGFNNFQYQ